MAVAKSAPAVPDTLATGPLPERIVALLPSSPLNAMLTANMLPVVVFSVFSGVALVMMPPKQARPLLELMESLLEVCMTIIAKLMKSGADARTIKTEADRIRLELNPHPAGQTSHNVPLHEGERLDGTQHKYHQTILFFPGQGQTCHAYCTFCFRWPQFVGMSELKFATRQIELLIDYLREHPEVTDVLVLIRPRRTSLSARCASRACPVWPMITQPRSTGKRWIGMAGSSVRCWWMAETLTWNRSGAAVGGTTRSI